MRDLPELNVVTFRAQGDELERLPLEAESLDAASARLPAGAYTTLCTYERRRILRLGDHAARLEQSARRLDPQMRVVLTRAQLACALGRALDLTGFTDSRVRITLAVPGGELFISVQLFRGLPPELFERGVAVATCPYVGHDTQAKATASISSLRGAQSTLPPWAHEGVMVDDDGHILEGLSSNFYAVKADVLCTAGAGIIMGTIRTIVLEQAAGWLPVVLEPIRTSDLGEVDDCFITSVSRQVLPVVCIDQQVIGRGVPGAITLELLRRFREHVHACAETV